MFSKPQRARDLLTAAIAAVYAVWTVQAGIRTGPDTATYSRWADLLIAHDFNFAAYLREQSFVVPPVMYVAWITVVAALKKYLGASWMAGVVMLNWMALVTGVYMTLRLVFRLTNGNRGLWLAAWFFLVAGDLLVFVPFVLSDLTFWAISTAVLTLGVAAGAGYAPQPRTSVAMLLAAGVLTAVAMVYRPTAAPLAVFWVAACLVRAGHGFTLRHVMRLLIGAVALAAIAIAAHAYILAHPARWPWGRLPDMLAILSKEYADGILLRELPTVAPAVDWLGAIRITLQRLLYFFTPWVAHYSAAHTVINILFFVPAYVLAAAAIVNLRRLAPPQQLSVGLLAAFAVVLSAFHAMMQIDYDHRYRLPLLPALIMLAAIGLDAMARRRAATVSYR